MNVNPYESPLHPAERRAEPTPWWMQAIQFCSLSIAISTTLGALSNVFNGWVCPEYFVYVLHLDPDSNVWLRAILQGILEGFVTGAVLSVAFFGIGSLLTRFRLTFARARRYLLATVIAAVAAAVTFGMVLMTLDFIRDVVLYHPDERFSPSFGWVAGCISGLEQGGVFAAFIALIVLVVRDWRRKSVALARESAREM